MNTTLLENNFIFLDEFITQQEATKLFRHFKQDSIDYPYAFQCGDSQCEKSLATFDYVPFIELLVEKTPFMSEIVGESMLPTYSYARLYKNGAILAPHTDRSACEVSITLHLGSDGVEWPIYFRKPDNSVVEVKMKPGQAVMYLGCVAEHWRDKYQGNAYGQVFLHYVRSRGPNGKYYFDKVRD